MEIFSRFWRFLDEFPRFWDRDDLIRGLAYHFIVLKMNFQQIEALVWVVMVSNEINTGSDRSVEKRTNSYFVNHGNEFRRAFVSMLSPPLIKYLNQWNSVFAGLKAEFLNTNVD